MFGSRPRDGARLCAAICIFAGIASSSAQPIPGPPFAGNSGDSTKLNWEDTDASSDIGRPKGAIEASLADELLARWNLGGCGNEGCRSNRSGFHPGTRVIVEMPALSSPSTGKSARANLQRYLAEFRNHGYWPFRACYEAAAREIGSRGGDTWVRVQLNAKGFIAQTRAIATNVDQSSTANCVAEAARSIRLPLIVRRRSTFVLRIRLFPGDAPLAMLKSRAPARDVIDPKFFGTEVNTLRKSIEDCTVLGVRRDPRLWGRISMLMKVAKDGHIVDFKETDSHFPDSTVIECSRIAARSTLLPKPPAAGVLQLVLRVGELGPMELDATNAVQPADSPQLRK